MNYDTKLHRSITPQHQQRSCGKVMFSITPVCSLGGSPETTVDLSKIVHLPALLPSTPPPPVIVTDMGTLPLALVPAPAPLPELFPTRIPRPPRQRGCPSSGPGLDPDPPPPELFKLVHLGAGVWSSTEIPSRFIVFLVGISASHNMT